MRSKLLAAAAIAVLLATSCSSGGDENTKPKDSDVVGSFDGDITPIPGGGDVLGGKGNGRVTIDRLKTKGPVLVRVTCECQDMSMLKVTADKDDFPLVDALGPFDGMTLVMNPKSKTLQVVTLGKWSIQFVPTSAAAQYSGIRFAGEGSMVLANNSPGGPTRVTFTPGTDDAFAQTSLFTVAEVKGTPFHHRGPTKANVSLSAEQGQLVVVSGDGDWTIERAKGPLVAPPKH